MRWSKLDTNELWLHLQCQVSEVSEFIKKNQWGMLHSPYQYKIDDETDKNWHY